MKTRVIGRRSLFILAGLLLLAVGACSDPMGLKAKKHKLEALQAGIAERTEKTSQALEYYTREERALIEEGKQKKDACGVQTYTSVNDSTCPGLPFHLQLLQKAVRYRLELQRIANQLAAAKPEVEFLLRDVSYDIRMREALKGPGAAALVQSINTVLNQYKLPAQSLIDEAKLPPFTTEQAWTLITMANQLVALTNQARAAQGIKALNPNAALTKAARACVQYAIDHDTFAWDPDWEHFFRDAGYNFSLAHPIRIVTQQTAESTYQFLMDSTNCPGCRADILAPRFTEIGIAAVAGVYEGRVIVAMALMLGSPAAASGSRSAAVVPSPALAPTLTKTPTPKPTRKPALTPTRTPVSKEAVSMTVASVRMGESVYYPVNGILRPDPTGKRFTISDFSNNGVWEPTGIFVQRGMDLRFSATGEWGLLSALRGRTCPGNEFTIGATKQVSVPCDGEVEMKLGSIHGLVSRNAVTVSITVSR